LACYESKLFVNHLLDINMSQPLRAAAKVGSRWSASAPLGLPGSCQQRWKHSATQVKRLFKRNPARIRVEARMGVNREPAPLDPPKYEAILEPKFLTNGWSAPPAADVQVPEYPFKVARTKNKPNEAVGFLPVYSEFR
jgi:hypothetical protein